MKRIMLLALLVATSIASADFFVATFDELSEGQFGPTMASGGVLFYDIDQNLGGGDNFTIEAANAGQLGASFTPPNTCGFGGYVPGTGVGFGRLKSFSMGMAGGSGLLKQVTLDFWTFLLQAPGNYVTLQGWMGPTLVNSVSYTPSTFVIDHVQLGLPRDDYDKFVLRCDGAVDNGVLFAVMDNVRVEGFPVPEPSGIVLSGFGLVALMKRRRARHKRPSSSRLGTVQ